VTEQASLRFIGHSSVLVEMDGIRLMTDPVTRARVGPLQRVVSVPHPRDLGARLDAVVISHLHWDHLDVPSLRGLGRDIPIIAPHGSGAWLRSAGFDDVREIAIGEALPIGEVSIRAVRAVHSGFRPPFGPTAPPLGFVLNGSRSIYFAGDTDLFDGMADLGQPIDMALLPVWGWGPTLGRGLHLDPLRAAKALRLIRPRAAMPIHWGTYWPHSLGMVYPNRLVEPPAAFVEYAAELAPDVRLVPTDVGDVAEWAP
jgi:L-ascorbate metabolism protein UlaG (beta-lactamase superfamily)